MTLHPESPNALARPDETSVTVERGRLLQMLFAFVSPQVLHVFARLGIADHLADGPRPSGTLAERTGSHEPSLYRLLRAAASLGLVEETERGVFALTAGGALLRSDVPGSVRNLAILFCGDEVWRSWGQLEFSVRTGDAAYEHLVGRPAFEYLAEHPEQEAIFNEAMAEGTRAALPGIVANCDLTECLTIADIGGGNGTLVAALLAANPHLHGVLFDTRPASCRLRPYSLMPGFPTTATSSPATSSKRCRMPATPTCSRA